MEAMGQNPRYEKLYYHGFEIEEMPQIGDNPGYVKIIYDFEIDGSQSFSPAYIIPSEEEDVASENTFLNLAFHLGLAELTKFLVKYKPSHVVIEPFGISDIQAKWWKDYYLAALKELYSEELSNVWDFELYFEDDDVLSSANFLIEDADNMGDEYPLVYIRSMKKTMDYSDSNIEKEFPWTAEFESNHRVEVRYYEDVTWGELEEQKGIIESLCGAYAATIWAYIKEESFVSCEHSLDFMLDSFESYEKQFIGSGTKIIEIKHS